jgi:hypothetical protein
MTTTTRRQQGRTSQRQGAALEDYLADSAARSGALSLTLIPAPVQILAPAPARQGRTADVCVMLARLEPPRAVDAMGHTHATADAPARPLYLEAKTTTLAASPRRWTLPDRLRLPDAAHPDRGHQGRILLDARASGAVAVVALRLDGPAASPLAPIVAADRSACGLYIIPVGIEGAPDLAAPSWAWADLAPYRAPSHGRWWEALR